RAVGTKPNGRRSGRLPEMAGEGRVVTVRVGDDDVAYGTRTDGGQQRLKVRSVLRSRINDCERAAPKDVSVGAVEGEGARIVDGHALDARRDVDRFSVVGLEFQIEFHAKASRLLIRPIAFSLPSEPFSWRLSG